MINPNVIGLLVAAFVAGSFVASPELRAYAANTVFSTDIVDGEVKTADLGANSVISAKIKDGEVKTADIATGAVASGRIAEGAVGTLKIADNSIAAVDIAPDAIGASELQGVTKLKFAECTINAFGSVVPGNAVLQNCTVSGTASGDNVIATKNAGNGCFKIVTAQANAANNVFIIWRNDCGTTQSLGVGEVSVIVYDM